MRNRRERILGAVSATAPIWLALLAACSTGRSSGKFSKPVSPLGRIAILQLDRGEPAADAALGERHDANPNPPLASNAQTVVTAQLYGILANDPHWRLVPDLDIDDAMRGVPMGGTLESRAQALGKEAKADAVVCGRVFRFQDRVGGDYGARFPASASFELRVVETATGEVLWAGAFDQTQQDLSSNLYNFWMFWQEGARWFTAPELARLGVEKLVADMDSTLEE